MKNTFMMNDKICITFAGVVGSSKTPIAHYLSTKLRLPIFSNDAIRSEVVVDLGVFNQAEYLARRNNRLQECIGQNSSFIFDASVDRHWGDLKKQLVTNNYKTYIISLDLSKELLLKLYEARGQTETHRIDELMNDHNNFLKQYPKDVNLHIADDTFHDRLNFSYNAIINSL